MNHRKIKKKRKKLYKDLIEDVALECSIDSLWRKRIMFSPYDVPIEIPYQKAEELPEYIREKLQRHRLEFQAMRVDSCPEYFDDGLAIFKFQSREYPQIVRYSGNNPDYV